MLDIQFPDTFRIGVRINEKILTDLCLRSLAYRSAVEEEEDNAWKIDPDVLESLLQKRGLRLTVLPVKHSQVFVGRSIADMCAWESKDAFWDNTVTAFMKLAHDLDFPDLLQTYQLAAHIVERT